MVEGYTSHVTEAVSPATRTLPAYVDQLEQRADMIEESHLPERGLHRRRAHALPPRARAGRLAARRRPRAVMRCDWASPTDPLMVAYHDEEWGVPVHDDRQLFERLMLEGARRDSPGTILNKRESFRRGIRRLGPRRGGALRARDAAAAGRPGIVRNRLKVAAAIGTPGRASSSQASRQLRRVRLVVRRRRPLVKRPDASGDLPAETDLAGDEQATSSGAASASSARPAVTRSCRRSGWWTTT